MSNERTRTIYLGPSSGGPNADPYATLNANQLYKPGELGATVPDVTMDRRWQLVQADSGNTAATATGVVAAGQLAFWKDKGNYLVTNDATQANAANAPAGGWGNAANATLDARNFVAGVFTNAVTPGAIPSTVTGGVAGVGTAGGDYTLILQRTDQSAGYPVKVNSGGTYNAGVLIVPNTGTAADGISVAAGTAPTCIALGVCLGVRNGTTGLAPVWLNLPESD